MRATEPSTPERPYRRRARAGAAFLVGGLLLAVATPARAFPEAPGIIVDELSRTAGPGKDATGCTPTCSMCHTSPSPDRSNAGTLMATNLLAFRMKERPGGGTYPTSIERTNFATFIQALENDPCKNPDDIACSMDPMNCGFCDGDADGTPDIAELRKDQDPNGSGKLACPQYGCGAHIAPERRSRPLDGTAVLAALSAAVVLVRRWRRR
jgi:hypothetical protein